MVCEAYHAHALWSFLSFYHDLRKKNNKHERWNFCNKKAIIKYYNRCRSTYFVFLFFPGPGIPTYIKYLRWNGALITGECHWLGTNHRGHITVFFSSNTRETTQITAWTRVDTLCPLDTGLFFKCISMAYLAHNLEFPCVQKCDYGLLAHNEK